MSYRFFIFALLALTPTVASAQTIQSLLLSFTTFVGNTLVPFVFGLAFLFFLVNITRYFIIDAANEAGRAKAKQFALWSIIAFVLMISLWAIVNMFVSDFGWTRTSPICPDYMQNCQGGNNSNNVNGNEAAQGTAFSASTDDDTLSGGDNGFGSIESDTLDDFGESDASHTLSQDGLEADFLESWEDDVLGEGGSWEDILSDSEMDVLVNSSSILPFSNFERVGSVSNSNSFGSTQQTSVVVSSPGQCSELLTDPISAAKLDPNEQGYVLYKDLQGNYRIVNATKESSSDGVIYDEDKINEIQQTGRDIHIIHTHPEKTIRPLLGTARKAPSTLDFLLLCRFPNTTHVAIDGDTMWQYNQQPGTCPLTNEAKDDLLFAETAGLLAELNPQTRSGAIDVALAGIDSMNELTSEQKEQRRQFLNDARMKSTEELSALHKEMLSTHGITLKEITPTQFCVQKTGTAT